MSPGGQFSLSRDTRRGSWLRLNQTKNPLNVDRGYAVGLIQARNPVPSTVFESLLVQWIEETAAPETSH